MSRHAMLWLLGAALAGCAAAPTEPLLQAHLAVVPERFEGTEATSAVNAPLP